MSPETEAAIREFISTAEGWTTVEKALEMAELILSLDRGCLAMEIGVFAGGSLIPQALALKEQDSGFIIGVDPWKVEAAIEGEVQENQEWWKNNVDLHQMHRITMEAVWKYGLDEYVNIVRSASSHVNFLPPMLDVLNVDGNHTEAASCHDVRTWLPFVRQGGFIWFDDVTWPSTQAALKIMSDHCELVRDHGNYRLYQKR